MRSRNLDIPREPSGPGRRPDADRRPGRLLQYRPGPRLLWKASSDARARSSWGRRPNRPTIEAVYPLYGQLIHVGTLALLTNGPTWRPYYRDLIGIWVSYPYPHWVVAGVSL